MGGGMKQGLNRLYGCGCHNLSFNGTTKKRSV